MEKTIDSQNKQIQKWLESGKKITPLEALKKFGSLRLSARIFDLRNKGLNIRTIDVVKGRKRFAEYSLVK